jgi:hypothetical protein
MSLVGDEEKIDYFINGQGGLDAFQKRTYKVTFSTDNLGSGCPGTAVYIDSSREKGYI